MRNLRVRAVTGALALVAAALSAGDVSAGVTATATKSDPRAAVAAAERLIATRPEVIHRSPKDRFLRQDVVAGMAGLQYVSYERTYAGLPVLGGDFVVVTDAAGRVLGTSVNQRAVLSAGILPAISPGDAAKAAKRRFTPTSGAPMRTSKPRLVVLARGNGRLTYETTVTGTAKGEPSTLHVLTDAATGWTIETWDEVHRGAAMAAPAVGDAVTYYNGPRLIDTTFDGTQYGLSDPLRPGVRCGGQDGATFTNPSNTWGSGGTDLFTACTDAMFAAAREWDMMRDWLNRRGFDGHGRGFPMRVGWDDAVQYGQWRNGDRYAQFGHIGSEQATSMDTIGHELGHSVFQFTPGGGDGGGQPKQSLNESTGDIFATLTEWYSQEPENPQADKPDYTIFEEVRTDRIMYQPSLIVRGEEGNDPDCADQVLPPMEIHAVAGVQNHWFYLLAEGSHADDPEHGRPNSPTCNGQSVDGIGIQKAGAIYMETLNRKTSDWDIGFARLRSLQAALQAFPNSCTEFTAVRAAWEAVNVHTVRDEPSCANQ